MDTPTYTIILSFIISAIVVIFTKLSKKTEAKKIKIMFFYFSAIWLLITSLGELLYDWAGNNVCSKYLGCIEGFFGYDAFEHLFFGIAMALGLILLDRLYPKYSLLRKEKWRMFIEIVAIIALVSVAWEMYECAHDAFRVDILHENLINWRIHLNLLDQPTNFDTMGDLTFDLLGGVIGFFLIFIKKKDNSISDKN